MPVSQLSLTPSLLGPSEIFASIAEKGTLEILALRLNQHPVQSHLLWAEIGIISVDLPNPTLDLILASGYITFDAGLSWSGQVTLEPAMQVACRISTNGTVELHFIWKTVL